jgi:hypothetical protein
MCQIFVLPMTTFWWVEFVTRRCDIQKRIRNASTLYEELEYLGSVAETERVCETQSSPPNHSHLIFRTIHSPVRYNVIIHTHILIKLMKQLKNLVPLSCNKKMRQRSFCTLWLNQSSLSFSYRPQVLLSLSEGKY